jgi:hypothetical protein
MSFPRHERSIVRWGLVCARNGCRSAQTLTVSMSRSRLFPGELLSSRDSPPLHQLRPSSLRRLEL